MLGTVYWSYPILPFGIVACTSFPTTFLEIAVTNYETDKRRDFINTKSHAGKKPLLAGYASVVLLSKLILTAVSTLLMKWPWSTLSKRARERFNDLAVVLFQNNSGTRTVSQSCTNARVLGLFGAKSTIERIKLFSAFIHGESWTLPFVDYFLNLYLAVHRYKWLHTNCTQYQKNQVKVIKKGIPSVGTEAQITYNKRSTDKQTIVGITPLELQVKCKCSWNLLWVWRGKMYLLQLYFVTMEMFVVQRSQSWPPSIDRFHCHATKKINWKPSKGRSQENEMLIYRFSQG